MTATPPPAAAPKANPVQWVATHQKQAGIGLAAVVAAYALYRRKKAAAAGGTTISGLATTSTDPNAAALTTAGLVAPSTSSTDIENWVQDALNSQNNTLMSRLAAAQPPAAPTPAAPAPAAPAAATFLYQPGLKYLRDASNGAIYQVNPDTGALFHIDGTQWAEVRQLDNNKPNLFGYGTAPAAAPAPAPARKPIATTPKKK